MTTKTKDVPLPANLIKVKAEGQKLLTPLEREVSELTISNPEEYEAADVVLGDIRRAREDWARKIGPIQNPLKEAMEKLKESMSGVVALNRAVDGPLGLMYDKVRGLMADYKRRELTANREAERQQEAEKQRLAKQIEEVAKQEVETASRALRNKLAARRERLEAEAAEVEEAAPEVAKGSASNARTVKAWRLAGTENSKTPTEAQLKDILRAVIAGKIPLEVVALNYSHINKVHLTQRDSMAKWPGFELFDDIVIAGR